MARCPDARNRELDALDGLLTVSQGMLIADVAAGDGYLAKHLAGRSARVVAIETSTELLDHLRETGTVECAHVANLCDLPLQDGRMDAVVSLASLHHVAHKKRVFAEVARVLRPGGSFVVGDVHDGTPTQAFFDDVCATYCYTGHDFDFVDISWIEQLAAKTGFAVEVARVLDTPWTFASRASALDFVRGLLGLDIELDKLEVRLRQHFTIREDGDAWVIGWQLGCYRLTRLA